MSISVRVLTSLGALLVASVVQPKQPTTQKSSSITTQTAVTAAPSENAIKQLIRAGRASEAIRLLEEQARQTPANRSLKARAAELYELQGDIPAAKEAAREAASGDEPRPDALAVLGRIAAREGDWATAATYWRGVIVATPNDATAHLDYSNALQHLGDTAAADSEIATFRLLSGMASVPSATTKK